MVDEDVVVDKLRLIDQYTDELREMQALSKEEYLDDVVSQRAVERMFMNLIQACIDLAQHIRATEGLSPSGTAKQEIEALGNAGILSEDTQRELADAVGFRNVLAHEYGSVDHHVVYGILRDDLPWFEELAKEIARWIQRHSPENDRET